jgi:cyclopropane fatty-acyl-phospholipid synthase-like methyltransferase
MSDYVLGHEPAELDRLALQSRPTDDLTDHVFRLAGLAPGMRVLDVGTGGGEVAILAARHTAPDGRVVSIDRADAALDQARVRIAAAALESRIELVRRDVDEPPEGPFDAVVGRLILLHLPDPQAALRLLVARVRPGGIVAVQELLSDIQRSFGTTALYER